MPNIPAAHTPIWAILLAAGSSSRLKTAGIVTRKQFLSLNGQPLFWRPAKTLANLARVRKLVFVLPANEFEMAQELVVNLDYADPLGVPWQAVAGGKRRQDSVAAGLTAIKPNTRPSEVPKNQEFVLVHDAARPFATVTLANRIVAALDTYARAVIPVVPVTDTIKRTAGNQVIETLARERLYATQTPQGFTIADLSVAHAIAATAGWTATDDATLAERLGIPVHTIPGEETNRKITTIDDLSLLSQAKAVTQVLPCTGMGYDVHCYGPGRPIKLGGIPIPGGPEVIAHSDGDVLLHALSDALLGLLAEGDIGSRFPDTDPAFDNVESTIFLNTILHDIRRAGIELTHVDCTLVAQIPKITPWARQIKANLAQLLTLSTSAVNIKATTEEKLGFTGKKKGIKAYALVTALRPATALLPELM